MKILLLALYNVHSYAIRTLHPWIERERPSCEVESLYFRTSVYMDTALPTQTDIRRLVRDIVNREPDILAVGVHSPLFLLFQAVSEEVRKQLPKCTIVIGGDHPTGAPDTCLPYADYVVVGDGEYPLLDIIDGNANKGIVRATKIVENLDTMPLIYYGPRACLHQSLLYKGTYSWYASRGCPNACSYCAQIPKSVANPCKEKVRVKSPERVIEELEHIKEVVPGIEGIFWSDLIFPSNTSWLKKFLGPYKKKIQLPFRCSASAKEITEENLSLLHDAGMISIRIGVQSGSELIRQKKYNRKETVEEIWNALDTAQRVGVKMNVDMIINSPFDTTGTLKDTRDFIAKLPQGTQVDWYNLRYFPGTPITKKALRKRWIRPDDVEGNFMQMGMWSYSNRRG